MWVYCSDNDVNSIHLTYFSAVEISDEEAEKIMTIKDAVEFLKKSLDIH